MPASGGRVRRIPWPTLAAAAIVLLAWLLRLREPLSSPIIGAEDPYLRMSNTWDVVQGRGLFTSHYPPGFSLLLAPFAFLGSSVFYFVARFGPTLLGAAEVAGVYVLCRRRLGTAAALVAATVVAVMPENIFRTNLLFPTALDLALLPWFFHLVLRVYEDSDRRALAMAAIMAVVMLVTHPWVVALLVPTVGIFALAMAGRERRRIVPLAAAAGTGGLCLVAALSFLPGTWNPTPAFFQNAGPRLVELVVNPASIAPLPVHVNLPLMLTVPVIVLAVVGAIVAVVRRSRLDVLALAWTGFLLPFVLVDWFDVWFIPHRTVAYLSVGVAVLAALPFDAAARALRDRMPTPARVAGTAAAIGIVLVLMLPSAFALGPWYRLYDEEDYEAWHDIAEDEPSYVVTASWQAAEGYRAITGGAAVYNPTFFENGEVRDALVRENPNIVVLIDEYARENGHPRDFLHGWEKLGEWDDGRVKAYAPW